MKRIARDHILFFLVLGSIVFLNNCGGGTSTSSSGSGPATTVPGAPIAVTAVAGDKTVTLSWSNVSTATSYNVYRSTTQGVVGQKISSPATTSYSDTGLSNGNTYYYVITAVNGLGESIYSNQVSAVPAVATGTITISGKVQYQDKIYGTSGFTGSQPYKAVRFAEVDLVSAANSSVLVSTSTDTSGIYSIQTSTLAAAVYVRVKATATIPGASSSISINSLSNSLYSIASANFTPSGGTTLDISIPTTSIGGAFNLLDVFTNGFLFDHSFASTYPPSLNAFWQAGNQLGTYYCPGNDPVNCPGGEGIYVLNYGGDTDEYDDDVLYHEFGHFTAAHFSQDDSPGGAHMLTNNDLDMRLAWSEGWGDSMPGNIKIWLNGSGQSNLLSSAPLVPLTEYVDTYGTGAGIAIDMDNPGSSYPQYATYFNYACNEVAVAKILLDSNINFGMQDVWSVLADFKTHAPSTPVNMELFWDRWLSLGQLTTSPSTSITLSSIFANRQIFYSLDGFEPDNSIISASTYTVNMTGTQNHTLYSDGDVDYVAFSATAGKPYTIKTMNLTNGADTILTLVNPDQMTLTPVVSPVTNPNDNASGINYISCTIYPSNPNCNYDYYDATGNYIYPLNDGSTLSSQITFQAPVSGMYYLSISSSPNRPLSAGRYGSYTLTITNP